MKKNLRDASREDITIINDAESFRKTLCFFKKYFSDVKVIRNEDSHLAKQSQNYFIIILFDNRGSTFSIKWNHAYSTLYFGDITKNDKTCFQYTFTKIKLDNCYPIEDGNNFNVVFWQFELALPHDDIALAISPVRIPITIELEKD